jgi:putative membrane protein insertion efficiency factor
VKYLLIGLLKVWRLAISPLYGNVCRYYPSCSAYALRSVQVHGAVKGSYLTVRRLLRCHPWAAGGYDPVPGTPEYAEEMREQAESAATMDTSALANRSASEVPEGPQSPSTQSHRHTSDEQTMQGRAVTVAQGRGAE